MSRWNPMSCATFEARRTDSQALRIFPLLPSNKACTTKHSSPSIQATMESSEQTRVVTVARIFSTRKAGVQGRRSRSISSSGGSCWRQEAIHRTALAMNAGWHSPRASSGTGSNFGSWSSNSHSRRSHQPLLAAEMMSKVSSEGIKAISSWRTCPKSGLIVLYAEVGASLSGSWAKNC